MYVESSQKLLFRHLAYRHEIGNRNRLSFTYSEPNGLNHVTGPHFEAIIVCLEGLCPLSIIILI